MSNENDNVIMQEFLKQYKEGKIQVNNMPNAQMGQMGQMNPQQSQMDPNTMAQFIQWQQQIQQFMQQQMFQQFYNQQMMQQQQMPQNPIQPPMQQNQPQGIENWNLTFERKENNDRIEIQISTDKFLEEAFNRYRIKSLITTGIKFSFGGKPLNENLKISKSGLHNNATIIVENDSNNNNPNNMNNKNNISFNIFFEKQQ